MTRRDDIRVLPSVALTVALIALVAFVTLHPRAAMWACVVALVLALAALFTVAIEAGREKARADDAERLACDLAEKLGATEVERDIATDLLARYKADARVVLPIRQKPDLRVVEQRTGSHDDLPPSAEVDGFAWPEIAREAFPIRQWGEEAES